MVVLEVIMVIPTHLVAMPLTVAVALVEDRAFLPEALEAIGELLQEAPAALAVPEIQAEVLTEAEAKSLEDTAEAHRPVSSRAGSLRTRWRSPRISGTMGQPVLDLEVMLGANECAITSSAVRPSWL